jgi:hypothetical protein
LTIAGIQAGKVQLAKVNARAYDTVGVNSFQALLAPFLIDNPTLEQRVPESDLAGEMLVGISRLGLVGLAMLPTDLRNRRACRVRWWRSGLPGTRIGIREGEVAKATFTASAPPRRYRPGGPLRRLDGAELDLSGTNWDEYDLQAKASPPGVSLSTPGGR